ncbi:MAG: PLP-dependent transferase, partial [Coriobacteriia bacterium]|nr:PLP-dependent transferase [Coriobacteriia bacterium]
GGCGVISFELDGGYDNAVKFLDSLKVARIATHVADARTCVLHPASTTHRQLSDEQRVEAGVAPTLVRLSVGIEDVRDLIADLDTALEVAFTD